MGISPPEVRDAWSQYLDEVRGTDDVRYPEVEPWAWARLMARLRIAKREKERAA
jgi:hypothetical protein